MVKWSIIQNETNVISGQKSLRSMSHISQRMHHEEENIYISHTTPYVNEWFGTFTVIYNFDKNSYFL